MNPLEGLAYGLELALSPELLLAALVGALVGTLIGVLPGLGPVAGAALILPLTFSFDPAIGLIMIAGIYLGAQYGGSITSVLLNIPGDASAVVATFDGHPMTKKGRGGAALSIMALGSFIAGTIAIVILLLTIPVVADVAMNFGPPAFLALTGGGLIVLARISGGSLGSGLLPMIIGVALATVGTEPTRSYERFTFGNLNLSLGVGLTVVAVGVYGISEIVYMLEDRQKTKSPLKVRFRELMPTKTEVRRSLGPWIRGPLIGFFFGVLPGPSATMSTFASYRVEKGLSKNKDEFGKGAVEGVAGPESANNAAAIGSILPVLLLGLPFSATLALMISAMTVHGIQPGPLLAEQHPDIFWSVIAAMLVANAMLLVLNLPLVGAWVRVLRTPIHYMIPIIILLAVIGAYSVHNNFIDVRWILVMGVVGYILRKLDFSLASLLVGLVLAPLIEKYFIQAMLIGGGDLSYVFVEQPIARTIWIIILLVIVGSVVTPLIRRWKSGRKNELPDEFAVDAD